MLHILLHISKKNERVKAWRTLDIESLLARRVFGTVAMCVSDQVRIDFEQIDKKVL